MKTRMLYLDDSYLKTMDAEILEVEEISPDRFKVVLDQTVFYPVGGGQATDQGKLTSDSWTAKVQEVVIKDGEIRHFIQTKTPPKAGMKVKGEIDWSRRYKHMKIHSGGHIVDFALHLLGYSPIPLMPYKGDHGKNAFIQYKGKIDKDIKQELENKANEIVKQNLKITWSFTTLEDLKKEAIYLQPGLPSDKPLRKITLDTVGSVADGGTQVKETGEIGGITIINVEKINDETLISYQLKQN